VLARVEPPPYVPVTLRGGVDEATERFQTAMKQYGKGNYAGAIPGLRAAAELNPKAANSRFFLAICLLLTGQTDSAIAGLQQVLALGDTPYLEEAHFYLAKAYLGKGSLTAAHDELERTIRLQGRLESEARQLLKQVNALKQEPPPG
jgi:tetratricopeptide (TPR) repeat protein